MATIRYRSHEGPDRQRRGHEHQIALLWQAIEKLSARSRELPSDDCVPGEAHTTETFDAERLNRLVK